MENPLPCSHCAMSRASLAASRPRRTKVAQQAPAHLLLHLGDPVFIELGRGMEGEAARRMRALQVGAPVLLSDAEMDDIVARFRTYGQMER